MSNAAPTVKDLYRVLTADFNASLAADKTKDAEAPRETIQHYLDRFVKSIASNSSNPHTPSTPSSANVAQHSTASFLAGATGSSGPSSSSGQAAAGRRHANELWYQSLSNTANQQHTDNLPFAFHRLSRQSSVVGSPTGSGPSSLNNSATGSPILSSVSAGQTHASGSSSAAAPASPSIHPTSSTFSISGTAPNANLAAQRFSAHLVGLYTQQGMGAIPIATIASRMIIYLSHLLPFLTPQLVLADWWDRLIEPSLQGEIKLDKDALKACRELVTECMIKDPLLDPQGSGSGSLLLAGDEEGQLDTSLAMAAMPIAQFVLRVYIKAAHKLNHRLDDTGASDLHSLGEGLQGSWLRSKERPNPGPHPGPSLSFTSTASASTTHSQSSIQKDLETQQRLFSKARALIRRKKDILVKNLEIILFAYGGGEKRVKDFFSCLYTYFVGARYRAEILGLLCQFIRRQRVHLHQILATPLFDSLVLSLKYDTSPLIVSLGLMTLIMMMPRIPSALNDRLPELFAVLARILCWPRSRQQLMAVTQQEGANLTGQTIKSFDEFDEDSSKTTPRTGVNQEGKVSGSPTLNGEIESEDIPLYQHGIRWRRYGPAAPGETSEGAPDPTAIFSFLYGLFPCNLLKFLHAPRIYLAQSLSPTGSPKIGSGHNSDDGEGVGDGGIMSPKESSAEQKAMYIDEDLLKSRVITLLKRHSLHPAMLNQTAEQEITDKARWQKLEPMEIVAMCVGLDVWSAGGLSGTGPILRSIEEDKRGAPVEDSDDDDDHVHFTGTGQRILTRSSIKASDSSDGDTRRAIKGSSSRLAQTAAGASVESLGSEESADLTPIEILAQEDFFGPRATADTGARTLHSGSSAGFASGISGPPLARTRVRSKEVRMSQILKNFATLRGLDQDDYLYDVEQQKTFGTSGIVSGQRRKSAQKQTNHELYSHPAAATSSGSIDTMTADIPATDEHRPTVTFISSTDLAVQTNAASLEAIAMMHQEYRKSIVQLERELLMAKNELNFELFLKQQHIQQISKVHRSHVLDASLEAERQNLYNTCRSLKAQLQETKVLLEKEKAELAQRKHKQTHWDTELKAKMQTFRDERKQLQFEVDRLKQDIDDTRQAQETQERLLTEERRGAFDLQNEIQDLSPKLKRMEEYEKRIEELTRQMVLWETEQSKSLEVQRQMDAVVGRWQNLELLLISEKEESRVLRNKVSQQSQILDDLRIQLAISEGRGPGAMPSTPTTEFQSEDDSHSLVPDDEREDGIDGSRGDEGDNDDTEDDHPTRLIRRVSSKSKATSLRQRGDGSRRAADMGWPSTFSRSSSNQTGFEQQRRAEAVQELMVREKERWDQELQQAHNRLSREAVRNQQLEDRILELQGQLEMARAIDLRVTPGFLGGHGGGLGHGGGGSGGGNGGMGDNEYVPTIHMEGPSQPVHFPHTPGGNDGIMRSHLDLHHHEESTAGGDTDDGGSTIGRYSQRQFDDADDGFSDPRIRSMGQHAHGQPYESYHGSDAIPPRPPGYPSQVGSMSSSSRLSGKGKSTSSSNLASVKGSKSRSKWLQSSSTLERTQTDSGTFGGVLSIGGNSHLGMQGPGSRKSVESFSTTGSGSTATRATTGGLYPPMNYTRNMSHRSDGGSSDVTTASDSSATGRQRTLRGRGNTRPVSDSEHRADLEVTSLGEAGGSTPGGSRSGSRSGSAASGSTSGGGSKKSGRNKEDKEQRDRDRDKIRLMGTMGPLVDPSKMYRNVRMF